MSYSENIIHLNIFFLQFTVEIKNILKIDGGKKNDAVILIVLDCIDRCYQIEFYHLVPTRRLRETFFFFKNNCCNFAKGK